MTKQCKQCGIVKEVSEFNKHKIMKDGLSVICRSCKKYNDKVTYEKNRETRLTKASEYYNNNREEILSKIDKDKKSIYRREYYKKNKQIENSNSKQYVINNQDSVKTQRREYRLNNRDKINDYFKYKKEIDPLFKLGITLRKRTKEILNIKSLDKSKSYIDYIGCSSETLRLHIESKFRDGMTWENHGSIWHIDHIIPLSIAKTEHQVYELCHYMNLQPLLVNENLTKNNKLTMCWQKFQRDKNIRVDKELGMNFDLNVNDFVLSHETITNEHREFIKKYEWLGTIGFGVRHCFTARHNNNLAGVVMIGEPNSPEFGEREALIQRGAVSSWAPKNLNSKLVMFSCRWMLYNTEKRFFTAYSDPEAGEVGTIYQACNFDYLGQTYGTDYLYRLENGRLVGSRYFTRTSSMKKWAREMNIPWQPDWCKPNGFQDVAKIPDEIKEYAKNKMNNLERIKQLPKGKYVLCLTKGRETIKKEWKQYPYPKRFKLTP
jgi:hypothetical protein